jgi:hypothetical protein
MGADQRAFARMIFLNREEDSVMKKRPAIFRRSLTAMAFLSAAVLSANAVSDDQSSRESHAGTLDNFKEFLGWGHVDMYAQQVKRGFEIVPSGVYLNLAGKNRGLVGLGSYLVNTSGCVDCHTHPSYVSDPFSGQPELINFQQYMTGGRQFGPGITAPNLTPDGSGKPAGLTLDQFIITLRTGHNPNDPPNHILQVMPWPVYGKKTDLDLTAMYEFLRALPSLPDNQSPGP